MPVMPCQKNGKSGFKWGENGVCFVGTNARKKAMEVGRAIHAKQNLSAKFDLSENRSNRVQVAKVGSFQHDVYGNFSITEKDLLEMRDNFFANARRQKNADGKPIVPFDYRHAETEEAAGWIEGLKIEPDKNGIPALFGEVSWTPRGARKIRDGEFRYVSPSIARKYKDNETGKMYNIVLKGAALTNVPFLRDMEVIHLLSEDSKKKFQSTYEKHKLGENMSFDKLLAEVTALSSEEREKLMSEMASGMDADAAEKIMLSEGAPLEKKFSDLKAEKEKAEADLRLSEEKNKKLKEDMSSSKDVADRLKLTENELSSTKKEVLNLTKKIATGEKKAEFDIMLSEGKVCEAQRKAFMENDVATFAKNARAFNLDERGQGALGDNGDDVEEKVLKLAEEIKEKKKLDTTSEAIRIVLQENPDLNKKYQEVHNV